MCGIAGQVSHGAEADIARVTAMTNRLRHRGPDGAGTHVSSDGQAVFGFRRLAIVDLLTGVQPIANEDGTVVSMLNGEIYNHRDLRGELSRLGHKFATDHADSEVIPHGYEEWGLEVLERLRGMFALSIWDSRISRLVLARDRLGEKPLYYRVSGRSLTFASEISALSEPGDKVDEDAIGLYLTYQYIAAPTTILREVRKLEPGEVTLFEKGSLSRRRYWSVDAAARTAEPTSVDRVVQLIQDAVRDRCEADVPIGAFLSGGVDSSVTTALLAANSGNREIHTFSMGFADPRLDETDAAESVATRLGTVHHPIRMDQADASTFELAIDSFGEPFADAAAVPTYVLAQEASRWVKVVLTGEGADELFGGYARYLYQYRLRLALSTPVGLRRFAAASFRRAPRLNRRLPARLGDLLVASKEDQPREWRAVLPRSLRYGLLPNLRIPSVDPILAAARASSEQDPMGASFATDLATWVPEDLLVKVDRATMAHGLEARPPFLDHVLVEAVLGLPANDRWRPGRDKPILREFATSILPEAVAYRPKQTFTTPTDEWLRGVLRKSNADATTALLDWGVDPAALSDLQTRSIRGNRDRGQWAWVMFVLGRWLVANPQIRSRTLD